MPNPTNVHAGMFENEMAFALLRLPFEPLQFAVEQTTDCRA